MSHASRPDREHSSLSRRDFLKGAGGVAATGVIGSRAQAVEAAPSEQDPLAGSVTISLDLNGESRELSVEPRTTLLSALRSHLDPPLTGAKLVCDRGNCGACTLLVDDQPVYSCLTLAVQAVGKKIRTVEGLARGDELTPVQRALVNHDGTMCGFCTPGFVMSLTACLERNPAADEQEIRERCSGNLCRCGTYPHIFSAALEAGRELRGGR